MALEVEFFGITGMVETGLNDLILLKGQPSTGLGPATGIMGYDIALDPTDGPAQQLGVDFGVTHWGSSGLLCLNLDSSDIKNTMNNYSHGVTGMMTLRVIYNH